MHKDIIGYEGMYQINEQGEIFSKKYKLLRKRKTYQAKSDDYIHVVLCKNGKVENLLLHRLLAIHFIPNPHPKKFRHINHKNWIKSDNRLENLEWCTHTHNMQHAVATGLKKTKKPLLS